MRDSEQLAMLWTKAQPFVAAYINSLLPDFHRAEDVLQQVAVVLVRKFDQSDSSQSFLSWALGIARRELLKQQRQRARDRHVFSDDLTAKLGQTYEKMAGQFDGYGQALRDCFKELTHVQ